MIRKRRDVTMLFRSLSLTVSPSTLIPHEHIHLPHIDTFGTYLYPHPTLPYIHVQPIFPNPPSPSYPLPHTLLLTHSPSHPLPHIPPPHTPTAGGKDNESAEDYFKHIMSETDTLILWPSRLKIGAKSKKGSGH